MARPQVRPAVVLGVLGLTRRAWDAFVRLNPDLIAGSAALLDRHYTPERLWSREARRRFLLPDRAPHPDHGT